MLPSKLRCLDLRVFEAQPKKEPSEKDGGLGRLRVKLGPEATGACGEAYDADEETEEQFLVALSV